MNKLILLLIIELFTLPTFAKENTSPLNAFYQGFGDYQKKFSNDAYDCSSKLKAASFPLMGVSQQDWTINNIADFLGYILGSQKTAFGQSIKSTLGQDTDNFETYLMGRDINPDIEQLYFLAKKKEARKFIAADEKSAREFAQNNVKSQINSYLKNSLTEMEKEIKSIKDQPLSSEALRDYAYPVNSDRAKEKILLANFDQKLKEFSEQLALITTCPQKLALNGTETNLTLEIHKYKERLIRKLEAKHLNDAQDVLDEYRKSGAY